MCHAPGCLPRLTAISATLSGKARRWCWKSGGKVTKDGYIVEIRLALQTIRFNGGSNGRMGILFWRHVSRSGVSYSWPDLPPGLWVFNRHAHLVFDELEQRKLGELLPSV